MIPSLLWKNVSSKSLKWLGLTISLLLITLGPTGFLCALLSVTFFIIGVCAIIYQQGREDMEVFKHRINSKIMPPLSTGFVSAKRKIKRQDFFNGSLTGSKLIDKHLQECLTYLIRDYVQYWYHEISDDPEFIETLHVVLADVIQTIAARCKVVDWQTYFTTKFVDDFASHLRLFRKAQEGCALINSQKTEQDNSSLSSNSSGGSQMKNEDNSKSKTEQIIDLFFDCEIDIEKTCRELVSCDLEKQKEYLQTTSEMVLYLILPKSDFQSQPLKLLLREIVTNGILLPLIKLLSDPDYINQYINWMISDNCLMSEAFLVVLRHSKNPAEVEAICEKTKEEIAKIRARDTVGDDPDIKQQLSSMHYVKELCERMLAKQICAEDVDELSSITIGKHGSLYNLPLDVTLRNNIALQFFIEFMQSIEQQAYLFFWLTVEGYRVSAEQQLNALRIQQLSGNIKGTPDIEMLRNIGRSIYDQYLCKTSSSCVEIDSAENHEILRKLNNEEPSPNVFDDLQKSVFTKMQRDENLYPAFKHTQQYVKLLAELDLLREPSLQSEDTFVMDEEGSVDFDEENYKLSAEITTTCICTEHGKSYAMFAISVVREQLNGDEVVNKDVWSTFRRYSDFAHLHDNLKESNCNMSTLKLPGKTIFKGLSDDFIQKRRTDLNAYLQAALALERTPAVVEALNTFLDANAYKKSTRTLAKRVDLMRSSMRTATGSFKDSIFRASDKVTDSLQRISQKRITITNGQLSIRQGQNQVEFFDNCRVAEQIDDIQDNIPLRILLLLVDEVFELKQKNQWFRRQVVVALQQFIRTVFGDRMNRKIVEYVDKAVSSDEVAGYIIRFSNSFWPSGILAEKLPERDEACKMRTQVLTKAKLLGAIPDELRPLVGTETSRRGVMRIFQMFQHPELNTRLIIILLEGVLQLLFPTNRFGEIFQKLNSASTKLQARKRMEKRKLNMK